MIGRGIIVIRRGNNNNELHFVNPWELSLAMYDARDKVKDFDAAVLQQAADKNWKPDAVVNDEELQCIRNANCSLPGGQDYHKHACDAIYIIDAQQHADPLTEVKNEQ